MEQEVLIKRAAAPLLALLIGLFAWLAVRHLREEPPSLPPPVRLTFPTPPGAELGFADEPLDAAISADETEIVFVATTDGVARLWRRGLDASDASALAGTEGASLPAWKRNGRVVSFFADGRLKQVSLHDGSVRDVAAAPASGGATWLPDGSLLFAPAATGPLQRLHHGSRSDATMMLPGDRVHVFPMFSEGRSKAAPASDGPGFVYVAVRDDGRKTVRIVTGGQQRDLVPTSGHAHVIGEHLLHVRDGVLVAERIDPETMAVSGRPTPLATSAGVSGSGHASFAASSTLLIVSPPAPRVRQMVWLDAASGRSETIGEPGDYWQLRLSPDDRYVAVTMVDPLLRTLDVTLMPADRPGDRERLTLALAADSDPAWSPDGARVVFRSMEDGTPKLFTRRAHDPEAPIEPGPLSARDATPTDWRDRRLLVTASGGGRSADIWTLDVAGGEPAPVADTGFNETDGRWSPDGAWVSYVSDESGQPDVYAIRGRERTRVSFAGGTKPRWSAGGRSLLFLRGREVMEARFDGGRFDTPRVVAVLAGISDFDVAHGGSRLLVLRSAQAVAASPATLVNWSTTLGGK